MVYCHRGGESLMSEHELSSSPDINHKNTSWSDSSAVQPRITDVTDNDELITQVWIGKLSKECERCDWQTTAPYTVCRIYVIYAIIWNERLPFRSTHPISSSYCMMTECEKNTRINLPSFSICELFSSFNISDRKWFLTVGEGSFLHIWWNFSWWYVGLSQSSEKKGKKQKMNHFILVSLRHYTSAESWCYLKAVKILPTPSLLLQPLGVIIHPH